MHVQSLCLNLVLPCVRQSRLERPISITVLSDFVTFAKTVGTMPEKVSPPRINFDLVDTSALVSK